MYMSYSIADGFDMVTDPLPPLPPSVLWDFTMTNVLSVEVARLRDALDQTSSLDEMIPLHEGQ